MHNEILMLFSIEKMSLITYLKMLISVRHKQHQTIYDLWVATIFYSFGWWISLRICLYLRYVSVGVHHVHVRSLDGRGGGHTRVSVTARVWAESCLTVGDLESLRREVVGRVGAQVDRVDWETMAGDHSCRGGGGVVPPLRGHGVRTTVGRSWNRHK